MALAFPLIIAAVFAIVVFSNKTTEQAASETKNQQFTFAVTDQTGTISPQLLGAFKAKQVTDKQAAIDQVTSGKLDAYFYYPKDLSKNRVEIYAKDVGLFDNGRYEGVAKVLLQQSINGKVDPATAAILQDKVNFNSTTYKAGKQFDGLKELIAPAIFLVMFYLLIAMFGNQMLTSTTEEKENRVIEMILTTIQARTLIIGKILSLIVLAIIQSAIIIVPIIAGYLLLRDQLQLPNIDLTQIPLDPVRIAIGAIVFSLSFLLFTGLLVAIGAAVPTAKEAGGFFGMIMVLLFGPLYAVTLFISQPDSVLVKFLSFFPLTAPIPLMLRNAVGNLTITDAMIGMAILAVSAALALAVAVRMFRYGALEYSNRLSLKAIFNSIK